MNWTEKAFSDSSYSVSQAGIPSKPLQLSIPSG